MSDIPRVHDPKELVARGYDAVAGAYAALERPEAEWPRLRRLRELLALTPEGSAVLDIGCGNGVPATRAIAAAHEAVGVDISHAQVDLARRNVPAASFVHGDIMAVDFRPGSFAAVVAFYVLDHLPRDEHAALFERVAGWPRPGGHFLFTVEHGEEPGMVGEWLGTPMFFSQFDSETTLTLLEGTGFEVLERAVEAQSEGDTEVEYLWVLARARGVTRGPRARRSASPR